MPTWSCARVDAAAPPARARPSSRARAPRRRPHTARTGRGDMYGAGGCVVVVGVGPERPGVASGTSSNSLPAQLGIAAEDRLLREEVAAARLAAAAEQVRRGRRRCVNQPSMAGTRVLAGAMGWGPPENETCSITSSAQPSPGRIQMRRSRPRPVAVAQAPHLQLAGRMARQLALEVDRARHLVAGEMCAAECEDLRFERRRRLRSRRASCTTAFTVSPHSSSGMPKTPTSATAGMLGEHLLDLGRIDVHAAGDDHVRLAIAEVDEAVGVDPADVAERRARPVRGRRRGLRGVAVVDEGSCMSRCRE